MGSFYMCMCNVYKNLMGQMAHLHFKWQYYQFYVYLRVVKADTHMHTTHIHSYIHTSHIYSTCGMTNKKEKRPPVISEKPILLKYTWKG